MDIGQETVTTASVTGESRSEEPFPWAAAFIVWSWCASLGLIAGVLVWWMT